MIVRALGSIVIGSVLLLPGCRPPKPVVTAPKPVQTPMPDPAAIAATAAAKAGKQGAVRVAYCVDNEGHAVDVRASEPFDPEFDALAIETVKTWTFEPAQRDGLAVEQCTDVRIELRPPPPQP
ncbi:MAG: energy transducer TonB [Nannocystaceae bacterium]|nr:energy transducer TonB [Nannocystaceae bacterium]